MLSVSDIASGVRSGYDLSRTQDAGSKLRDTSPLRLFSKLNESQIYDEAP